jgi:hypothetical protein
VAGVVRILWVLAQSHRCHPSHHHRDSVSWNTGRDRHYRSSRNDDQRLTSRLREWVE